MVCWSPVGICVRSNSPRTNVLGNFQSSLRDWSCYEPKTQHSPGFPVRSAGNICLILSTNPNRKSGFVLGYFQPDLSKLGSATKSRVSHLEFGKPGGAPQIPPLRCAPVGMTILLGSAKYRSQDGLSSRPERSVVEGSVVRHPAFPNSPWDTRDFVAEPNLDKSYSQPSLRGSIWSAP